jgi:fumarate hydratase class II
MSTPSDDPPPSYVDGPIGIEAEIDGRLIPSVKALHDEIAAKSAQWMDVVKIGRTHLEDVRHGDG